MHMGFSGCSMTALASLLLLLQGGHAIATSTTFLLLWCEVFGNPQESKMGNDGWLDCQPALSTSGGLLHRHHMRMHSRLFVSWPSACAMR
jgi:hypothetical protein